MYVSRTCRGTAVWAEVYVVPEEDEDLVRSMTEDDLDDLLDLHGMTVDVDLELDETLDDTSISD